MVKNTQWMNGTQSNDQASNAIPFNSGVTFYEIRIRGQLNSRWSEWLEGLEVKLLDNGEMTLLGPVIDQAALMGILNKLSYLNLTLLSVNEVSRMMNKEKK